MNSGQLGRCDQDKGFLVLMFGLAGKRLKLDYSGGFSDPRELSSGGISSPHECKSLSYTPAGIFVRSFCFLLHLARVWPLGKTYDLAR